MINFKKTVFLISVILMISNVFGQTAHNDDLVIMSFVKKDSVLIRWAPTNSNLLKNLIKNGCFIDRINTLNNDSFENNSTLKTIEIKPFFKEAVTNGKVKQLQNILDSYIKTTAINKSEEDYTFGMLLLSSSSDNELAKMMNTYYVDTDISNSENYKYRIRLNSKKRENIALEVNAKQISKSIELTTLFGKADNKRKDAFLKWEAESLQSDYSAYWIERSLDSSHFTIINTNPYVFFKSSDEMDKTFIDYIDTSVVEGNTYWYRIKGINHFGEVGAISNVVKISMKRILKGIVKLDTIYADKFDRIIQGRYEATNNKDSKTLKSFVLLKSKEMHNNFSVVGEQDAINTSYDFTINSLLTSGDRNYFKVGAISIDNDTIFSFTRYFFTLDQIPPSQPKGLSGTIDENGIVKLKWTYNPEDDIKGYRVYRSNSMDEEFVEDTKYFVDSNFYYDTLPLNNLTSEVFYRIAAVDLNYNNSDHSAAIELLKPDSIPPVPCLFVGYKSTTYGMELKWINSSSNDVVQSRLIVKKHTGIDSIVIMWNDTLNSFIDSSAVLGQKNTYYIKTKDKSENTISSKEITVVYETGKRPSVSNLTSELNIEDREIRIFWELPKSEIYSLKIYRAKNDGAYRLIKTTKNLEDKTFSDKNLAINNNYSYKIKVVYQSGITSVFSNIEKVKF